jgi:hypothetical protein
MTNADELYQEYIEPLPSAEKRRLLTLISRGLAGDDDDGEEHAILEIEGGAQRSGRTWTPRSMSTHCAMNGIIMVDPFVKTLE